MIWLYRLLFPVAMIAASPYYLWRMARRGGYGKGFAQRFGALPRLPARRSGVRRVWIQAVSVGEMLAIGPILRALHEEGTEVLLTTTTSTGLRVALDRHLGLVLCVAYFPIDWWPFSARAWRRAAPDLAVVTEGERWPEHMRQAAARRVPVLCINARISDRSFRRLSLVRPAAAFVLAGMDRVLAGSAQDAGRFRELGFPAGRITVTGNIKLDVDIAALPEQARAALRRELGLPDNRLVLLGSSTWPGEEEALLGALRHARARAIACSLLIVPRHAERRADVERLLRASGFAFHLRSLGAAPSEVDVCLADTTGELRTLTQVADLVFVGKSLPPHTQGQTPVEAAALGKPIIVGPGTGNFREIASDLVRRGAARRVSDAADLSVQVAALLGDPSERAALADAAAGWRRENRGGVGRTLEAIRAELGRPR